MATLEKLFSSLASAHDEQVFRPTHEYEPFVGITIVSANGVASMSFWAKEHVGGLLDVEVIDGDANQVLVRHVEDRPLPTSRTPGTNCLVRI